MTTDDRRKLATLMAHFSHAMLTTRRGNELRSRPMAIMDAHPDGRLLFFSNADSGKLEELHDDPQANVSMQDASRFVSISGSLRVFRDPDLAARVWQESQREWFPEGPSDPSLVLIEIEPTYAEYWDRTTVSALQLIFSPSQANLESLGEDADHGKINLDAD